jgi:prephenate dehydrogenase
MRLFKKVAIVGTGLIGGSIALAIKSKGLAGEIVGVSRRSKSIRYAKKIGAIDRGSVDPDIIKGADAVILATPVQSIIKTAPAIVKIVKRDCLVTDVGSTKVEIVKALSRIFPNFVGSHPLAGSEKTSIVQARRNMFEGSLCILVPTVKTRPAVLSKIRILWKKLGARTVVLGPADHDKILSFVSHLPHAVSFSLINSIPDRYLKYASSGLKDTTRIAGSDSELWAQILLSNRKNTAEAIEVLEGHLSRIKSAIRRKDKRLLKAVLKQAKNKRGMLEKA